jgi:hypothetical protein
MQSLIKLSEQAPLGDRVTVIINHVNERPADDDEFGTMLRRDALTVLANSLVENQPPELLSDELLRVLIADLTDSDCILLIRPHDASQLSANTDRSNNCSPKWGRRLLQKWPKKKACYAINYSKEKHNYCSWNWRDEQTDTTQKSLR